MEEKIQRLSEGMDFIEESCGYMPLTLTDTIETDIMESAGGSTFKIIGKACGPFQPVGEFSRNNRLYEQDHWNIQLENLQFQDRLKSRDLLGTIGHHDKKVDDADIAAGIVSHIVTCLEIREDKNGTPYLYGELEILDTPAGRNLKALYEGGANLYVSSRGAGKLLPVPNESYKKVDKMNYFCETFDVVRRPGFLKAKPLYEEIHTHENVNEAELQEGRKEGETDDEFKTRLHKELVHKADNEADKAKEAGNEEARQKAHKKLAKLDDISPVYNAYANEEVSQLKAQIEKLTKIVEKVVDDVYEEENSEVDEATDKITEMLFDPSISEEMFEELENVLSDANAELLQKVMENSRNKFNDEHSEKSGLKIDYYRYGGNKPYKVVPKDKSYFEASWSSPRFRSLKQAQKHVLDSYNKPKENASESISQVAQLLANSNISEKALVEVLELLVNDKEQA